MNQLAAVDPTQALRFQLGTRVQCNTGAWSTGTIVQLHYRESHWPPNRIVPYQVRLDDGRFIFAPADNNRLIRELPKSPIHDALDVGDLDALRLLCSKPDTASYVNKPNLKGDPPIIYLLSPETESLSSWDDEKILEAASILKDCNCALGTCNMQGSTVLHCVAERGSCLLMAEMLEWTKEEKYCLSINEQNMEGSEYTDGEWSVIDGDRRYMNESQIEEHKSQPNIYHDTVR